MGWDTCGDHANTGDTTIDRENLLTHKRPEYLNGKVRGSDGRFCYLGV